MDARDVRRRWAERSGAYSPDYYAHHGPDGTSEAIGAVLERAVGRDAAVLEVGCSAGRHLAHLHERGFRDLHGLEVNDDAFDVMAATYPDLASDGSFYRAAIEDVVPGVPDGRFAAVFSVETLQHVHPDATDVFADLARIAGDVLVTGEIERGAGTADGSGPEPPDTGDGDRRPGADAGRTDGTDAARNGAAAPSTEGPDPDVNFVDEGLPLYYRDWERVFTERDMVQVDAFEASRATVRTFRHPPD